MARIVNAFGNSSIHSTANAGSGIRVVGDDFTLTLKDNSSISTTGSGARAVFLTGDNGTITLNDQAAISAADHCHYHRWRRQHPDPQQ